MRTAIYLIRPPHKNQTNRRLVFLATSLCTKYFYNYKIQALDSNKEELANKEELNTYI
jgi:hypothetical protein